MNAPDCSSVIISSLQCLIAGDVVGVCRNQRTGNATINTLRKSDESNYFQSLLNSTETLLDICRDIATRTGLTLWQKCELEVVSQELLKERIFETDDFIKHAMVECLKDMSIDDSDKDGDYNYLRLLQNLRATLVATHHLRE